METVHKDFAKPIVDAIDALNAKERRQILIELEAGSLSYSKILQKTRLEKGTLNYHLKKLVASGLLRRYLREGKLYTSFYEVTNLGRRLIEGILNAFRPSPWVAIASSTVTTIDFKSSEGTYYDRERPFELQNVISYYSIRSRIDRLRIYPVYYFLFDASSSTSPTIEGETVNYPKSETAPRVNPT